MDMDTIVFEALDNSFEGMKNLLAQYQCELNEIKSGKNTAANYAAEKELEKKIEDLASKIIRFEDEHDYAF